MPFLLFILFPIFELVVFIQIGARFGVLFVLGFILLSAIVGMSVLRNYSILNVIQMQKSMAQGRLPLESIGSGLWLALAGLLLVLPGFITSALGVLLLLPFTRTLLTQRLLKKASFQAHSMSANIKDVDDVVVVEEYRIVGKQGDMHTRHTIEGEFRQDK